MSTATLSEDGFVLPIAEASYPEPFAQGLEFNAPVRGPWNIVHMALMIPEAHLLYICARGCLRGVIMTAAEMGAMARMSWIGLTEDELTTGLLDARCFEAAEAILTKLSPKPPLVLLYLSCVHKFVQLDYPALLVKLSARFPHIRFIDCHMMPTMRKSGPSDEERTKSKMYEALEGQKPEEKTVALIGNDWPLQRESLLFQMLAQANYKLLELATCQSYADFQRLGSATYLLTTHLDALLATQNLAKRLKRTHLDLPASFAFSEIRANLTRLSETLAIPLPNLDEAEDKAVQALDALKKELASRPITLDYTITSRPLSLARLLRQWGFALSCVFIDAISPLEWDDFCWLQKQAGDLLLIYTRAPYLRFEALRRSRLGLQGDTVLALGQKAAYFSATDHFVNLTAGGGLSDYAGIIALCRHMQEASRKSKDRRTCIQLKGLGEPSCLCGTPCHPALQGS